MVSDTSNAQDDQRLPGIEAAIGARSLPPVHRWRPTREGELDLRIARNGEWFYQGSLITRQRMVKLFSTVLRADSDGSIWLVTPQEKLRITVEDAPFTAPLVERLGTDAEPSLVFTTNLGDPVIADADHLIEVRYPQGPTGEPAPYVRVRDELWALIGRQAFLELAGWAETRGDELGVVSRGTFMTLGRV